MTSPPSRSLIMNTLMKENTTDETDDVVEGGIDDAPKILTPAEKRKAYMKAYQQTEKHKAYRKAYRQTRKSELAEGSPSKRSDPTTTTPTKD